MDPWPAWAILYLACAIVYVVYLLVNFYYKNKLPPKQSNLNKSNISLSSNLGSYKDLSNLYDKNSSISNRLNQINKSISILEEKILKSGKSHLLTRKRDDTCTTGLDYLRKGLRNRKKQIPKDPKDIIFEQKDRERKAKKMAQNLEIIKQDTLSLQDDIGSVVEFIREFIFNKKDSNVSIFSAPSSAFSSPYKFEPQIWPVAPQNKTPSHDIHH